MRGWRCGPPRAAFLEPRSRFLPGGGAVRDDVAGHGGGATRDCDAAEGELPPLSFPRP